MTSGLSWKNFQAAPIGGGWVRVVLLPTGHTASASTPEAAIDIIMSQLERKAPDPK